jgi:hypothetical protein
MKSTVFLFTICRESSHPRPSTWGGQQMGGFISTGSSSWFLQCGTHGPAAEHSPSILLHLGAALKMRRFGLGRSTPYLDIYLGPSSPAAVGSKGTSFLWATIPSSSSMRQKGLSTDMSPMPRDVWVMRMDTMDMGLSTLMDSTTPLFLQVGPYPY